MREALQKSKESGKPIFFNCHAGWAGGCRAMDAFVFSDQEFADWLEEHFVNLWVDMVKSDLGKNLAQKYNVNTFAHYLILDQEGEVIHRIVGGGRIEPFKAKVAKALKPETSLRGLAEHYASVGDKDLGLMRNYLEALLDADYNEQYNELAKHYLEIVGEKGRLQAESWDILRRQGRKMEQPWFEYIEQHTTELTQINGDQVKKHLLNGYISELLPYVKGKSDPEKVEQLEKSIRNLHYEVPNAQMALGLVEIANYRQKKDYKKMMVCWQEFVPQVDHPSIKFDLDYSLKNIEKPSSSLKNTISAYLKSQAEGEKGKALERYQELEKSFL